jgi:Raf kinase inhibitor-like YbhB/YbcL family protein
MTFLELIGHALRPFHSDDSKLTESDTAVKAHPHSIVVSSPVFSAGTAIPKPYSADGTGLFPAINWEGLPVDCQSLILVVEDPDAPKATPFVHGIFYNIPASLAGLPEEAVLSDGLSLDYVNLGIQMGKNTMSKTEYMAPAPPPGHGPHHYHFQLIALDIVLDLPGEPTLVEIKKALTGHVLGSGELIGIYER